jgi:hypothetical protein
MPAQKEDGGAVAVTSAMSWAEMPSRSTRSRFKRPTPTSSEVAGKRTVRPSSPGMRPQAMRGMGSGPSPSTIRRTVLVSAMRPGEVVAVSSRSSGEVRAVPGEGRAGGW